MLPVNSVLDGGYRIMRVVGSGGFGITYEAEDLNLGTMVAVKEYYPIEFGDRDATMSVRPKSERHKPTFDKGRTNFLEEARTLARFEHPSIVRVSRVFETNSTAYMVMRFEQGMSLEAWLRSLERSPSQNELDLLVTPLLDALEMMHAANFLHRDIAPDNIIVRADGTPVLLDFGAARRAVAEMSRSLTGIVKAGYSPHEQYASDGRLQGPWSDLYAFGATLYRAVTGKPPEESMLRVDEDSMRPAVEAARGDYRREFLAAIDACLKVRHAERPRSVAQLRPMLLGRASQPPAARLTRPTQQVPQAGLPAAPQELPRRTAKKRWPAIAAVLAILAGSYAGYEYQRFDTPAGSPGARLSTAAVDSSAARKAEEQARERQAALEAERRRQRELEAADARRRQVEAEDDRRRREQIAAAEAEARRKAEEAAERRRQDDARIAALEETRRKQETAAEEKRREEQRIAALDEARRTEDRRREDSAGGGARPARRHPQRHPTSRPGAQGAGGAQARPLLRRRRQRPRRGYPGEPRPLRREREQEGGSHAPPYRARQGQRRRLRVLAQGRRRDQGRRLPGLQAPASQGRASREEAAGRQGNDGGLRAAQGPARAQRKQVGPGQQRGVPQHLSRRRRQSLGPEALQPPLRGRLAPDARPAKPARPWRRRGSARG